MLKKVIYAGLVALFFLAMFIYVQLRFTSDKQQGQDVYGYVSSRSALICQLDKVDELTKTLQHSNLIWSDLINIPFWNRVDLFLKDIDQKASIVDRIVISAIQNSAKEFDFITFISFKQALTHNEIKEISTFKDVKHVGTYQTIDLYQITQQEKELFYFLDGQIAGVSVSKQLLEEAIDVSSQAERSLKQSTTFLKAQRYAGSDLDGNLFINFKHSPIVFSQAMSKKHRDQLEILQNVGDWLSLDLQVKPNYINANGFIVNADSSQSILNYFDGQYPIKSGMSQVIPSKAAFAMNFMFSDFYGYLSRLHQGKVLSPSIERISEAFTGEISYALVSKGQLNNYEKLAILKIRDDQALQRVLDQVELSKDYLQRYFGSFFKEFKSQSHKIVDDYLFVAESQQVLDWFVKTPLKVNSLSSDVRFQEFNRHFAKKSNVQVYIRPSENKLLLADYLSAQSLVFIEKYDFLFHKFETVGMHLSREQDNLFYATLQATYNASKSNYPSMLWEYFGEDKFTRQPFYFKNHRTGLYDVAIQDNSNQFYLISAGGKAIFKRQFNSPIQGSIYQVDAFKNNKHQLLFATLNKVYLIDRDGKDVEGFPIDVAQKISNQGVQLFDYDQNKNYRILIGTKDHKILNYNISGSPVEGWAFQKTSTELAAPIKHTSVQNKDYLTAIDEKGAVYVFNRKGESRINLDRAVKLQYADFDVVKAQDIESSFICYTDNVGAIHKLYFNGEHRIEPHQNFVSNHSFKRTVQPDQKVRYVYTSKNKLEVFSTSLDTIFSFQAPSRLDAGVKTYIFNEQEYIGAVSKAAEQIYLLDQKGALYKHFPLPGVTQFSIKDINADGKLDLATCTQQGALRLYSLEE